MYTLLIIVGGLSWTIAYIAIIYNGFKYKNYSMPFAALSLNIFWELIYSLYGFDIERISLQRIVNFVWLTLDFIMVYQYFAYGRKNFTKKLSKKFFIPWSVLVLTICFLVQYMFLIEFIPIKAANYTAFLQSLVMSFLFISFLINRNEIKDISMTVAISKFLGTLMFTIVFGTSNQFVFVIGLLCGVVDICYIGLLYYFKTREKELMAL